MLFPGVVSIARAWQCLALVSWSVIKEQKDECEMQAECVPLKSHVETLTPHMIIFGDGTFER